MRALLQRVSRASVSVVDGEAERQVAEIGQGLLALVGVRTGDTEATARQLADKVVGLRVFEDEAGKLNLSLQQVGGSLLVVSNFTLYGDCRKGRRPSFVQAAPGPEAEHLYLCFCEAAAEAGVPIGRGVFGAHMHVDLLNDGPVTLLLETDAE